MSSWTSTDFIANAISVSSQGSFAWALSDAGDLCQFDGSWNLVSTPSTHPFVSVSAGLDSSVIALNSNNEVFFYSLGGWTEMSTTFSVLSASLGDADNFVLVGTSGLINAYNYGSESVLYSKTAPTKLSCTAGLEHVWGINGAGKVFKWNGSSWEIIPGQLLKQIDVSLSISGDLQVVGVDTYGNGWRYLDGSWTTIPAISGNVFSSLEASAGFIWATSALGQVYTKSF